jgi:hypothetical protein
VLGSRIAGEETVMTKPTWRELLLLLGLAGVALVLLNHNVVRAQRPGKPPVFTQFKSKLALDGYDAVAYFKGYLNYNASVRTSWERNIPGHIAKGNRNWPVVLGK